MTLFIHINHFACPTADIMLYSVLSHILCNQLQRNPGSLLASHHRKSVLITVNELMKKPQSLTSPLYNAKMKDYRKQSVVNTHTKL